MNRVRAFASSEAVVIYIKLRSIYTHTHTHTSWYSISLSTKAGIYRVEPIDVPWHGITSVQDGPNRVGGDLFNPTV
jgi:hypothetical protein